MLIGYARTSTSDQKAGLADQIAELRKAGCERIFEEHGSGIDAARVKLKEAIDFARENDVIYVTKADRIARSAADLLGIVQTIRAKGADVRVMSLDLDTRSPTGKLMLVTLAGMAEFERDIMLERQRAGIAAAKAAGKYKGRAPTARRKAAEILELSDAGIGETEIGRRLGISRSSVYRILGEALKARASVPTTAANAANITPAQPEASIKADEAHQRLIADYQATGKRRPPWLIEADIERIRAVDPTVAQQWKTALLG